MDKRDALIRLSGLKAGGDRSPPDLEVRGLSLAYPDNENALREISLAIPAGKITSVIGPSGCGKSTLLRCFNRMNDLIEGAEYTGSILLEGQNILARDTDVTLLRRRIGMVFQRPNPFPKSIYENVAYGPRIGGIRRKRQLDAIVEHSLRSAALWDEVADRLYESALTLSLGQQQRLVIARTIAIEPEILLLDEPASSLDPISTLRIEELIYELKHSYTIIIVTHNMQQAARVSDMTAFMHLGRLVEFDRTDTIFTNPSRRETEDYITGRYG
ncbi:phosphate ABC transporter, ATP-binding protein [Luminiphilus syltensis NOR5-1B]|uniref:Phosphate ABC transporter, ATP-binding protein n=1 Tax=Luminiphilus syltensis NOR5-1B TaxID=565045 RepID=B8KRT2_9GAMM|nr:phosphate ABC transporter ATP-binding protein PstB [Luminiphilus syltensis]EED36760.1 phosphate ABC transporter, ATP-binding protein [Luminiphilus syltensis NOR5-1B]